MEIWTSEQRMRLAFEEQLLAQELPHFKFEDRTQRGLTTVRGDYHSSAGNSYKICVRINVNYPDEMPNMYVISPCPLKGYGNKTIQSYGTSHAMHVWEPDWNNYVKICHWKNDYWSASNTILGVLMKGFLWIEALEVNRKTGQKIDKYSLNFS